MQRSFAPVFALASLASLARSLNRQPSERNILEIFWEYFENIANFAKLPFGLRNGIEIIRLES